MCHKLSKSSVPWPELIPPELVVWSLAKGMLVWAHVSSGPARAGTVNWLYWALQPHSDHPKSSSWGGQEMRAARVAHK